MNRVKELRTGTGLSQKEFAEKAKIGVATLVRLENGGKAYATTLVKIANYCKIPYSELENFEAINPKGGHQPKLNSLVA